MLNNLTEVFEDLDKFDYIPQLGFKTKRSQGTLLGGFFTIIIGGIILYYLGSELRLMAEFKGYYQRSSFTVANLTEIGIVQLEDMGSLPFLSVHHEGK